MSEVDACGGIYKEYVVEKSIVERNQFDIMGSFSSSLDGRVTSHAVRIIPNPGLPVPFKNGNI